MKYKILKTGKGIALSLFVLVMVATVSLRTKFFVSAKEKEEDKGPLTKITFIHYKKDKSDGKTGKARPTRQPSTSCYGFLTKGAKWRTTEDYLINPTGGDGLSEAFVKDAVDAGVTEWEEYGGEAIFGGGSTDYTVSYNSGNLDGKNTASFGVYPQANVIAVTSVWGYFSGPPQLRELVEWDILFNTGSTWEWGDALIDSTLMDLQNIATHELGHSAGMKDLYETACTAETMYGYSDEGEITKRDLNAGDIKGIQELY